MKKSLLLFALGLATVMPAKAQWTNWNTTSAISGVFGVLNHSIESAERKKAMEIQAREKIEYEQTFKDAMESARDYEGGEYWDDALTITRKINGLYVKAGRTDDGPSILNNAKTILPDYSGYRYVRENPVYVNKKVTNTKIARIACSSTETRLEMEFESSYVNFGMYVRGTAYIKGNKGGKLGLSGVENITMAPAETKIPWPGQRLRFVLIFPPLPDDATEFDFIVPSSEWKFKDIRCK